MQMKNLLIILQGKVSYLNPDVFGAPVPQSWVFSAVLVPTRRREHQSVLGVRSLQTLQRDLQALTASAQSAHGPGKGGDEKDHS